jgi:hypothetical protein
MTQEEERYRYLTLKAKAAAANAMPVEEKKPESPGLLGRLAQVAERVDAYGGAPVRSAIGALQQGNNPISAFGKQFGAPAAQAPTGKELVQKAGVPNTALSDVVPGLYSENGQGLLPQKGGWLDPTASGVAGMGLDIATDPTLYLPVGAMAKGASKALGVEKLAAGAGKVAAKVAGTVSGVSPELVENYAKNAGAIDKMIKQYGPDLATAADDVRQKFTSTIAKSKKELNSAIGETLARVDPEKRISVTPILESLDKYKAKINPNLHPEELEAIDGMISRISKAAPDGVADPKSFYEISQFLNSHASGGFQKPGVIFNRSAPSAKAAVEATAQSRQIIASELPEISQANAQLSRLHRIEANMNKNLIASGKPEGALITAGSSENRGRNSLALLERATGGKFVQPAVDLATQKAFTNPGLLPGGAHTGYAVGRMGVGGLLGYEAGGNLQSAIEGAALSSPAAIKALIKGGRAVGKVGSAVGIKRGLIGAEELGRQNER